MEERIKILELEIAAMKERNRRVELEKAWETSGFRIFSITAATYAIAAAVLYFIGAKNFLSAAAVPTVGYWLSTLSLPSIKRRRLKQFLQKR